jgi:hypothetical protein
MDRHSIRRRKTLDSPAESVSNPARGAFPHAPDHPMPAFAFLSPVRCLGLAGIAAALLCTGARAALEVKAKAIMTGSKAHEAIGVIRIDLRNTGPSPLGPLLIQYRFSGYREFEPDGEPVGAVEHQAATLTQELIPPGKLASIDSPGMTLASDRAQRKLFRSMIQSIRVRVWQHGRLIGEFAERSGVGANVEWPLDAPPIPAGAEVGSGPWLLLEKDRADFSGLALGAPATEVLKMLKTCGTGKIDAKPEPFRGHPFRMSSTDFPGCTLGFDAAKNLSAIEVTVPSSLKLPGDLLLGKSGLEDFDAVFGAGSQPEPLPPGAAAARRYQLKGSRLTLTANSATPGIVSAILLERAP